MVVAITLSNMVVHPQHQLQTKQLVEVMTVGIAQVQAVQEEIQKELVEKEYLLQQQYMVVAITLSNMVVHPQHQLQTKHLVEVMTVGIAQVQAVQEEIQDLEEELRAGLGEWDEAQFVDDEQLESGQLLLEVEQSPLVPGLDQLVDQRGGRGEADRQSPLAGGESQTEGHMGLAGAAVADGDDVLPPVYVLAACQLHGQVLVHRRHGQEVEGVEALGGGEACRLDPAVNHPMMAVYQLKLREPQQVARMVDALGGALAGYLAVLSQERRQLQLLEVMLQQHRRPLAHRPIPDMSAM